MEIQNSETIKEIYNSLNENNQNILNMLAKAIKIGEGEKENDKI